MKVKKYATAQNLQNSSNGNTNSKASIWKDGQVLDSKLKQLWFPNQIFDNSGSEQSEFD